MAAPQFFVPPRVSPSKSKRRFTVEQANKSLPLVSRIVADIVRVHKNATHTQAQIERLAAGSKEKTTVEAELEATLERLQDLVTELSVVGCQVKDFQMGLVDFIGRNGGRDVCLCWKLGEARIEFWHELDAGFAGRQPIASLDEGE